MKSIWDLESNGNIRCKLCPRQCLIADGKVGFCKVRTNEGGVGRLLVHGRPSALAVDPIEKKPLYHFYPGSSILSLGTVGCNLDCNFCQNWHISRSDFDDLPFKDSSILMEQALKHGCIGIAYTYNEPIVFFEYVEEMAALAVQKELKNVVVSAGYISKELRPHFFENMDAANIDLKAFDESFYRNYCGGHLQVILETLTFIRERTDIWLEITNLIIPGVNDDSRVIAKMCRWIVENLGAATPLHFSAFFPCHRLQDRPVTPVATLKKAFEIAKEAGLKHVYLGNIGEPRRLFCSICHHECNESGICSHCGQKISGHFRL